MTQAANWIQQSIITGGVSDLVLGSIVNGGVSLGAAFGNSDAADVIYSIKRPDDTYAECGLCDYTHATLTISNRRPFSTYDSGVYDASNPSPVNVPNDSILFSGITAEDYLSFLNKDVKVSVDDTTPSFLDDKLIVLLGDLVKITNSPAGDEKLELALASTGITPGDYTSVDVTVDAKGRITAIANGSSGGGWQDGATVTYWIDGGNSVTLTTPGPDNVPINDGQFLRLTGPAGDFTVNFTGVAPTGDDVRSVTLKLNNATGFTPVFTWNSAPLAGSIETPTWGSSTWFLQFSIDTDGLYLIGATEME